MELKVSLNNLRTAPRKVRLVADLVRNKSISDARSMLQFTTKKAADRILNLLNSAIASAVNDLKLDESNLYISKITVDEGPKLKRWHPMSRGRAYPIMKRTSRITLVLSEKNNSESLKSKKVDSAKKEKMKSEKIKMKNGNPKLKNKKRAKSAS